MHDMDVFFLIKFQETLVFLFVRKKKISRSEANNTSYCLFLLFFRKKKLKSPLSISIRETTIKFNHIVDFLKQKFYYCITKQPHY